MRRVSGLNAMLSFVGRSGGSPRRPVSTTVANTLQARDRLSFLLARRRPNCLHASATLATALRWQGVPAQLAVGVAQRPFRAHAWVELEGKPLGEPPEATDRFTVIARF